jgi:hypothetical protein
VVDFKVFHSEIWAKIVKAKPQARLLPTDVSQPMRNFLGGVPSGQVTVLLQKQTCSVH